MTRFYTLMNPSISACASIVVLVCVCAGCSDSSSPPVASTTAPPFLEATNCDFSKPVIQPLKKPRAFVPGPELAGKSPRDPDYALAWTLFHTVEEYKRIGRKNPAWDADAIAALEAFAELLVNHSKDKGPALEAALQRVIAPASKALRADCTDPLLHFVYASCAIDRGNVTPEQLDESYGGAADALAASEYPSIRKAYAFLCASQAYLNLRGYGQKTKPRAIHLARGAVFYFSEALLDTTMPPQEASSAANYLLHEFSENTIALNQMLQSFVPTLQKSWNDHAFSHYFIGSLHLAKAWETRNLAVENKPDDPRRKASRDQVARAEESLKRSYAMDATDSRVPVKMINCITAADEPRAEMETWFDRAMTIDTNCYDAASAKIYYLEPRWLRERDGENALAFARECVESKKWGGRVPLVLPQLHANLQQYYKIDLAAYYSDPKVWKDIDTAYRRFFELNPTDVNYRHDYARDAYRCKQYNVFLEQLPLFTTGTNYNFFGSRASFEAMVQLAAAKAAHP